jgi:hypothetical protein
MNLKNKTTYCIVGRDSLVGIATSYWLDGLGIESRWGRDFPRMSRSALGPTHPPIYNGYRVFPGGKTSGVWHWPPIPSSAEVKERVERYLYFSPGPSWPAVGWTLLIALPFICLRNLKFVKRKQICFFIEEIHFVVPGGRTSPPPPPNHPASPRRTNVCLYRWDSSCESGGIRIWNAAKLKIHITAGKVKIQNTWLAQWPTCHLRGESMSELHVRNRIYITHWRTKYDGSLISGFGLSRLGEQVFRLRQTNKLLGMISEEPPKVHRPK